MDAARRPKYDNADNAKEAVRNNAQRPKYDNLDEKGALVDTPKPKPKYDNVGEDGSLVSNEGFFSVSSTGTRYNNPSVNATQPRVTKREISITQKMLKEREVEVSEKKLLRFYEEKSLIKDICGSTIHDVYKKAACDLAFRWLEELSQGKSGEVSQAMMWEEVKDEPEDRKLDTHFPEGKESAKTAYNNVCADLSAKASEIKEVDQRLTGKELLKKIYSWIENHAQFELRVMRKHTKNNDENNEQDAFHFYVLEQKSIFTLGYLNEPKNLEGLVYRFTCIPFNDVRALYKTADSNSVVVIRNCAVSEDKSLEKKPTGSETVKGNFDENIRVYSLDQIIHDELSNQLPGYNRASSLMEPEQKFKRLCASALQEHKQHGMFPKDILKDLAKCYEEGNGIDRNEEMAKHLTTLLNGLEDKPQLEEPKPAPKKQEATPVETKGRVNPPKQNKRSSFISLLSKIDLRGLTELPKDEE